MTSPLSERTRHRPEPIAADAGSPGVGCPDRFFWEPSSGLERTRRPYHVLLRAIVRNPRQRFWVDSAVFGWGHLLPVEHPAQTQPHFALTTRISRPGERSVRRLNHSVVSGSHARSALRMDVPRLRRAVDARTATGQSHRVKSCEPSGSQDFGVSKEIDLLAHDAHGWRSRWCSHSTPALNRALLDRFSLRNAGQRLRECARRAIQGGGTRTVSDHAIASILSKRTKWSGTGDVKPRSASKVASSSSGVFGRRAEALLTMPQIRLCLRRRRAKRLPAAASRTARGRREDPGRSYLTTTVSVSVFVSPRVIKFRSSGVWTFLAVNR